MREQINALIAGAAKSTLRSHLRGTQFTTFEKQLYLMGSGFPGNACTMLI